MNRFVLFVAAWGLSLTAGHAQNVIASYDFSNGSDHWSGRTADTKNPPAVQVLSDEGSKDLGKSYLSVKTDGRLGTGVRLAQGVQLARGESYGLSFWVKVADVVPVSFRILSSQMDGADFGFGDRRGHWHAVPPLAANTWTRVTLPFVAEQPVVGLDIVTSADGPPTTLSIADVQLVERGGQDFPVVTFDFAGGPGPWSGRAGVGSTAPPALTVQSSVPEEPGKSYLVAKTDGKLGSGFRLAQVVEVTPGSPYKLTFWLRTTAPVTISYRIIGTKAAAGDVEYGDQSQAWHVVPTFEANRWTKVEYAFTAATSLIGVDIAAGTDHIPTEIFLSDPQIVSSSP